MKPNRAKMMKEMKGRLVPLPLRYQHEKTTPLTYPITDGEQEIAIAGKPPAQLPAEPWQRAQAIAAARDLYDFDNEFTAPVHGFRGTEDYWTRASGKPWLRSVRVPHLVLNALNDPFVPARSLPTSADVSQFVRLEQPRQGGHVGFARGWPPGELGFLPQRVFDFFAGG